MARLIKTNGEETTVKPAGREFTNDELHQLINCEFLHGITLGGPEGLFMFIDDTGLIDGKPFNKKATEMVRKYKPGYPFHVCGDVVVASRRETGE